MNCVTKYFVCTNITSFKCTECTNLRTLGLREMHEKEKCVVEHLVCMYENNAIFSIHVCNALNKRKTEPIF